MGLGGFGWKNPGQKGYPRSETWFYHTLQSAILTLKPGNRTFLNWLDTLQISDNLLQDLRSLIIETRRGVAQQVNFALVMLYWRAGKRIRQDILKEKRAEYGEEIVSTLSTQLVSEFGSSFSTRNLWHMLRFAEVFPDEKIVNALSTQLGWTHFRQIIALDDPLKRDFYAEMCRIERWSTRTLEKKISGESLGNQ